MTKYACCIRCAGVFRGGEQLYFFVLVLLIIFIIVVMLMIMIRLLMIIETEVNGLSMQYAQQLRVAGFKSTLW